MNEHRDSDHIRSFVTRATRMSKAQRRHWDTLYHRYCVTLADGPIDPRELFGDRDGPVVLEIGFGMGDATAELAAARPETCFLGVEVHRPGVGKLLGLLEERGITNVRILSEDAVTVLERMVAPVSLDGIHLFFPDPWPKKRHHKRRIVRPGLARLMAERLRPGGYLYMVTDWSQYAEAALDVLTATPGLANAYAGYAEPQPWRPATAFERKGRAAGRAIVELFFRRV